MSAYLKRCRIGQVFGCKQKVLEVKKALNRIDIVVVHRKAGKAGFICQFDDLFRRCADVNGCNIPPRRHHAAHGKIPIPEDIGEHHPLIAADKAAFFPSLKKIPQVFFGNGRRVLRPAYAAQPQQHAGNGRKQRHSRSEERHQKQNHVRKRQAHRIGIHERNRLRQNFAEDQQKYRSGGHCNTESRIAEELYCCCGQHNGNRNIDNAVAD